MVSLARGGGVRQGAGLKGAHALPPGWRRSGFLRALAAALVAATLGAFTAGACTVCDGGTGPEVRRSVFNGEFFRNAAAVLSPFPVFAAAAAWLHFGAPRAGRARASSHE